MIKWDKNWDLRTRGSKIADGVTRVGWFLLRVLTLLLVLAYVAFKAYREYRIWTR